MKLAPRTVTVSKSYAWAQPCESCCWTGSVRALQAGSVRGLTVWITSVSTSWGSKTTGNFGSVRKSKDQKFWSQASLSEVLAELNNWAWPCDRDDLYDPSVAQFLHQQNGNNTDYLPGLWFTLKPLLQMLAYSRCLFNSSHHQRCFHSFQWPVHRS